MFYIFFNTNTELFTDIYKLNILANFKSLLTRDIYMPTHFNLLRSTTEGMSGTLGAKEYFKEDLQDGRRG